MLYRQRPRGLIATGIRVYIYKLLLGNSKSSKSVEITLQTRDVECDTCWLLGDYDKRQSQRTDKQI